MEAEVRHDPGADATPALLVGLAVLGRWVAADRLPDAGRPTGIVPVAVELHVAGRPERDLREDPLRSVDWGGERLQEVRHGLVQDDPAVLAVLRLAERERVALEVDVVPGQLQDLPAARPGEAGKRGNGLEVGRQLLEQLYELVLLKEADAAVVDPRLLHRHGGSCGEHLS